MNKTKILYLVTKGNFGGAQRYVYDLATSLPKDQFEVTVAFGDGNILGEKLTEAGIRTIQINSLKRDINPLLDFSTLIELIKLFRKERPDIIHLNSSKIGGLGALAGRIAGVKKIIFTTHGWAFNEPRPWISRQCLKVLQWITIVLSHITIDLSEKTRKQVLHWPFISKKVQVVYNGIDTIEFKEGFEARQFLNKGISESVWIGTISELHLNKGLDVAIEAFAEIVSEYPDCAFVIIGEGDERKKLEALTEEKKLTHNVHLLGHIPDAQKYLKAFDIFTLTSRKEGFPYALLEAGYAGLPVIASDVGGISEIITDKVSGLLTRPTHKEDIVKALEFMLQNPKQREIFGNNLNKKVKADFSKGKMVRETIKLYQK